MSTSIEDFTNKVHHGDCLELMKGMPDNSINLILTDLPYGTTKCRWDVPIDPVLLWEQYERILCKNGVVILTATQPFASMMISSNKKLFKYDMIWKKTAGSNYLNVKIQPMRFHEHILVFYGKKATYNPQMTHGHKRKRSIKVVREVKEESIYQSTSKLTSYDSTSRYPSSVLTFPGVPKIHCTHPTEKPVALLSYLIETYSNVGDIVLDGCSGSGATGDACIQTGRAWILIDKTEKYFNISTKRTERAAREKHIRDQQLILKL